MNQAPVSMKGLPYVPLDPVWVLESRAFLSGDSRLVRAVTKLLFYAWRATPAGSISADMQRIGSLCELTDQEVGEHFDDLLDGWQMQEGRYFHVAMTALCDRLHNKFGDVLENLADQAAAMPQAPEEFELTAPAVESRTKGRRLLPKDFSIAPEMRLWLKQNGFDTDEDASFILEKFRTYAQKDSVKANNWDAAFKNFALKENKRNLPSRQNPVVPVGGGQAGLGRSARYGGGYGSAARAENAVEHNRQVFGGGPHGG